MRFAESSLTNAPPKSAEPIPARQLVAHALDWIEAQVQTDDDTLPSSALLRQLGKCEQVVSTAWQLLSLQKAVEIRGPAETYPLTVGLGIIAVASGKPCGFAAVPKTWSEEDWQTVTAAMETLRTAALSYRPGFSTMSLEYQR